LWRPRNRHTPPRPSEAIRTQDAPMLYRVYYVLRDAFGEVPWSDSGTAHVPRIPHRLVGSFASLARVVEMMEKLQAGTRLRIRAARPRRRSARRERELEPFEFRDAEEACPRHAELNAEPRQLGPGVPFFVDEVTGVVASRPEDAEG